MKGKGQKASVQVCMQPGDAPDLLVFRSDGSFFGDLACGAIEYVERHPEFEGDLMRVAWNQAGVTIHRGGEYGLDIRLTHDGAWSQLSYHTPYGDFPMMAKLLLWDLQTPEDGFPSVNVLYELLFANQSSVVQLKLEAFPS